ASSTWTLSAEDRLASPREASTIAASALRESPRSAAIRRRRRQNASSSETLVRWPAMTSERLTTRPPVSWIIGMVEPVSVEDAFALLALRLDRQPLGLRHPGQDAI